MKGFVKTYAGKCITFTLCILSLILLLGSVFGIFVMVECDFYTKDKKSIEDSLVSGEIKNDLYPIIFEASRDPSLTHVSSEDYLVMSFPLGVLPHTHTGKSGGHIQP